MIITCRHCGKRAPESTPTPYICPCGKSGHYENGDTATSRAIALAQAGGPAFPHVVRNDADAVEGGMTLRDYFAAKIAAAQSVATSADTSYMMPDYAYPDGEQTVAQKIAANAYAVADALLAERAK
jgi:hypothetical protein